MGISIQETFSSSFWWTSSLVFFGTLAVLFLKGWWDNKRFEAVLKEQKKVGNITAEELQKYSGHDPFLPLLFSVNGTVYDVSKGKDFYGPGGGYAIFAGKEIARALAVMSLKLEDCTDSIEGVTDKQLKTLSDWEDKFRTKYEVVGKLVPPINLDLESLRQYDGSQSGLPIYLSIKGTIFDVSKGHQFYGPGGIYPFAGRECARAFALVSTDTADCNDNLDGLGAMELGSLRDWQDKFYSKYKIVGHVEQVKAI